MSVTISISPASEGTWMIRNAVYRWLVSRVAELHTDEAELVECLTVCGYHGGISLELERAESSELVARIVTALVATIDYVLTHRIPLTDDEGAPWPELQPQVYQSLAELRSLLNRFPVDTEP